MADRRARAARIRSGEKRPHVVRAASGHAQPDDVDQQLLGALAHRRRDSLRRQGRDAVGKQLGNGYGGQCRAHRLAFLQWWAQTRKQHPC